MLVIFSLVIGCSCVLFGLWVVLEYKYKLFGISRLGYENIK